MTTSTPTPGMWLRVTPEGKSKPVTVFLDGVSQRTYWGSRVGSGDVKQDDPEGTIYYPISLKLLKAAAAMADAIGHEVWSCDLEEAYDAYRAAVEKKVSNA